jgi:hypothetical protein
MVQLTKHGVIITLEIYVDERGKISLANLDNRFGPKGIIGRFVRDSMAKRQAHDLLVRHGELPGRASGSCSRKPLHRLPLDS